MEQDIEKACTALSAIFEAFDGVQNSQRLVNSSQGWTFPALSPSHIAYLAQSMQRSLEALNLNGSDDIAKNILIDVNMTLSYIVSDVLPNVSGSVPAAIQQTAISLTFIHAQLGPLIGWDSTDKTKLPGPMIRRLNQIDREITGLVPDVSLLNDQIKLIVDATEAAEALPSTMQELKATQAEIRQVSNTSSELFGKIQELHKKVSEHKEATEALASEGERLIKLASEAHRVTTTVGLAAAFDERATSLNRSVYIWVSGLALSLVMVLIIGYFRLEDMRATFNITPFDGARIWTQVALSVVSVAAPVWFAWLTTKQVGQRFRLAEDYAFKASVAKAYEGYRREAQDLSPDFAKTLFSSALTRLDEAPLRLLDMSNHGSPLHEALESSIFSRLRRQTESKASTGAGPAEKTTAETKPTPDDET